jgi:3-oxoacyl-[acyl-carrier protein] reductase
LDGITALVESASTKLDGPLDGLVHAAGAHIALPLRSTTVASVRDIFDLNVVSAVMLAKGFRVKQVRGPNPSVVFLSSAVGIVGQAGVSTYSASKGAIVSLTKSLALELARENIRVNCVCPGVVTTDMTVGIRDRVGASAFERVIAAHPLGLGEPQDVANSVLYLLSSASRWVTGSALAIDGGYTAQ